MTASPIADHTHRDGARGYTVVLVDDHTMLRQGLRRSLESEGVIVLAEAGDGDGGVAAALAHHPDVVLMDVSMPGTDGIDATHRLTSADRRQRVVMLTMHADRDTVERAIRAGAVGYVTKDSSVRDVVLAIALAANGDTALSPRLAEVMLTEATRGTAAGEPPVLGAREEEVLQLIADGCATSEVAERMFISQKTVKNHLASIYDKLQARDRTQAVLMAVKMGIVKLQ